MPMVLLHRHTPSLMGCCSNSMARHLVFHACRVRPAAGCVQVSDMHRAPHEWLSAQQATGDSTWVSVCQHSAADCAKQRLVRVQHFSMMYTELPQMAFSVHPCPMVLLLAVCARAPTQPHNMQGHSAVRQRACTPGQDGQQAGRPGKPGLHAALPPSRPPSLAGAARWQARPARS